MRTDVFLGLAFVACGCEGVPALSFENPDDAAALIDQSTADDSDIDVILGDGKAADASANGCPNDVPATASVCCGAVACNGNCTATQCSMCQAQCGTDTLCCARPNSVTCKPAGASCP